MLVQSPASEIALLTEVMQVTVVKANPTHKGVDVLLNPYRTHLTSKERMQAS